MISNEIKYLYLISDNEDDFITTSFEMNSDLVTIYNFNEEVIPFDISYLAIDYSWDAFSSFTGNKYSNSKALKFYKCYFVSQDVDRMTLTLRIVETDDVINLKEYKRDVKINKIINE